MKNVRFHRLVWDNEIWAPTCPCVGLEDGISLGSRLRVLGSKQARMYIQDAIDSFGDHGCPDCLPNTDVIAQDVLVTWE